MEIKRYENNDGYAYILDNGIDSLKISLEGKEDLYFSVNSNKNDIYFNITKENMEIYNLFDDLYNEIKNADVFKLSDEELNLCYFESQKEALIKEKNRWNSSLRGSYVHQKLFKNDFVNWISDDSINEDYNKSNTLIIKKGKEKYSLIIGIHDINTCFSRAIRIKNKDSRYNEFSLCMLRFYNKLQSYDPEYHQMHINEYLYKIKTKI